MWIRRRRGSIGCSRLGQLAKCEVAGRKITVRDAKRRIDAHDGSQDWQRLVVSTEAHQLRRALVLERGFAHGDFRFRCKHCSSVGLHASSPKPSTKTSSQPSALSARGAGPPLSRRASTAADEDELAEVEALDAPDSEAPRLLVSAGTPDDEPPT